jgi:DNA repair photolyase
MTRHHLSDTSAGRSRPGRGALSNAGSRYLPFDTVYEPGAERPVAATEYRAVQARSIIARNASPDLPFNQSVNPYQGCEHGCIYCYARPSHAYHDLSPGLDFETRLTYKENAALLLRRELSRPGYRACGITLGANTDPYQPVENRHAITRQLLQVFLETRHPVSVITRSGLVTRDIDLLAPLAAEGLCSVGISVTTLDSDLKRRMEPRAPSARARLEAMQELSGANIPVTLMFSPVIPGLNDVDLEAIVTMAAEAGASRAACMLLRLPREVRDLFYDWLERHYPLRADKVRGLLRQCRGGADNDSRFGSRMTGEGPVAELIRRRFALACRRAGLSTTERPALRTDLFRPPRDDTAQRDLFD